MGNKDLSEVQNEIVRQVLAAVPIRVLMQYGLKQIIKDGDNSLRFYFKKRKITKIDITYNYGSDTYAVKAYVHKFNDLENIDTVLDIDDVYFDQFADIFGDVLGIKKE